MSGIDALADVVACTLGPRGRTLMLANGGTPHVTRDGVEAALAVQLPDRLANLGAELLRSVVSDTSSRVGDGTVTAMVLARAMARRAVALLDAGLAPGELREGLEQAARAVHSELEHQARPLELHEVARVAELSAGTDVDCELLARALESVGANGLIEIEAAQGVESSLRVELGARFARGYLSPYFVTDAIRSECVFENARVLLCHTPLAELSALVPLLEASLKEDVPLLIVAEDVLGDALSALVLNCRRANLRCVAVRAPGFGSERREHLRDLALLTGGFVVGDASGHTLSNLEFAALGRARRVTVTPEHTTLLGGAGEPALVHARLAEARRALEAAQRDTSKSDSERKALAERVRALSNGAAVISIGGYTDAEIRSRKDCLEDALAAVRAALTSGVVLGGGVALLQSEHAIRALVGTSPGRQAGRDIVRAALSEPLRRLLQNADCDADEGLARVRTSACGVGFDVVTRRYCDLEQARIWDPLEVVAQSFHAAVRVTSLLLTSGACLIGSEAPFDDFADV